MKNSAGVMVLPEWEDAFSSAEPGKGECLQQKLDSFVEDKRAKKILSLNQILPWWVNHNDLSPV